MSFEIIDNTFQVIVLAAMALLAFILASGAAAAPA